MLEVPRRDVVPDRVPRDVVGRLVPTDLAGLSADDDDELQQEYPGVGLSVE